jgi:glycosyltransferase involved in cell wall biosynthesis
MPAYNESEYIESNLYDAVRTLSELGYDYEVIVVDDGSSDNTYLHAVKVLSRHPQKVRVVRYDVNRGKGNALICGTTYATGNYVVFLDSDMDLHPEQLPVLFAIMDEQKADVVIGSKRHPLSKVTYPLIRRLYSATYYGLVRVLFGLPLRDTQTGMKVFKIDVLRKVFPKVLVKRFAFDVEVLTLAHRSGYKVVDAPVTLAFQRRYGRIKPQDVFCIFCDTLAIFYRMKILRYYDRHADDLPWPSEGRGGREVFLTLADPVQASPQDAVALKLRDQSP